MRDLLRRVMLVAMNVALRKPRMTREEFFAWAQIQGARYEFDGFQPVAMTGASVNTTTSSGTSIAPSMPA